MADTDLVVGAVRDRLAANRERLRTQNLDTTGFIMTRDLRRLVSMVIEERSDHPTSSELRDALISLFQGYLIKRGA